MCEKEGEGAVLADNTLHSFHIAAKRFGRPCVDALLFHAHNKDHGKKASGYFIRFATLEIKFLLIKILFRVVVRTPARI